jgi:hypothetical protein
MRLRWKIAQILVLTVQLPSLAQSHRDDPERLDQEADETLFPLRQGEEDGLN